MSATPTIIVVDDDLDARFFVERSIRRAIPSSRVIALASAAAAFEELKRGTAVDAIITDHQLRLTSGCDFIRELRQEGYARPVVMVTCSGDPTVARAAYEAGATKVFEAGGDEFAEFLKETLSQREAGKSPGPKK
jgi:CheY-like chemotaxis protein